MGSPLLHGGVIKYPGGLLNPGGVHNSFYFDRVVIGDGGGAYLLLITLQNKKVAGSNLPLPKH